MLPADHDDRHVAGPHGAHGTDHVDRGDVVQVAVDQQHVVAVMAEAVDQVPAGKEEGALETRKGEQVLDGVEAGRTAGQQGDVGRNTHATTTRKLKRIDGEEPSERSGGMPGRTIVIPLNVGPLGTGSGLSTERVDNWQAAAGTPAPARHCIGAPKNEAGQPAYGDRGMPSCDGYARIRINPCTGPQRRTIRLC
ncbi:hypothetical protein D3C81_1388090 [compost metagenome]